MMRWPSKKYQIIYADPPWEYNDKLNSHSAKMGACEYHYPTMSNRDIAKLPVKDIADDNCILFLWVTMPRLIDEGNEIYKIISAWSFTYKTVAFTWVKMNPVSETIFKGTGHWVQGNAELVLLCTKGKPKRIHKDISQIVLAKRGKHSVKPSEVRRRIVKLMGDLSRIELFARKEELLFDAEGFEGWDIWGNEAED